MERLLNDPDKGVDKTYGANGVLSSFWRTILRNLNITGPRFSSLLQDYIMDSRHGVPNNRMDQTSMRGNLTKEFAKPQLTWKVFMKALRFLQIYKIDLTIKTYHMKPFRVGDKLISETYHTKTVLLGDRNQLKQFTEALEQDETKEAVEHIEYLDDNN